MSGSSNFCDQAGQAAQRHVGTRRPASYPSRRSASSSPGGSTPRSDDVDELGDRGALGESAEAPGAQDRAFERELRRQSRLDLRRGRHLCRSCSRGSRSAPSRRCSMRSARARSVNTPSGQRDFERAGHLGVEPRDVAPRRFASKSANQRAMRWKRGHQNARASGKSSSAAKCFSPSRISSPTMSSGSLSLNAAVKSPIAPWMTLPRSRAPGGVSIGVERAQAEDMPGVDRVGIAQPQLDLGDRQRRRPHGARRLRLRPRDRLRLPASARRARAPARR